MAKRKSPKETGYGMIGMAEQSPHEKKLSEMHDALYSLGDKIRKPYPRSGEKLLPAELQEQEPDGAKAARKHIDNLHAAMKGCKD
jgi:hypothetical protein